MIIIDRFESEITVVEFGEKFYDIPRAWLPAGAKEGDVVALTMVVDEEETARRRVEMERKLGELFE